MPQLEGLTTNEMRERIAALEADIRYLLKFVPPWAKEVPEGLCPTMYGTLTAEGDRKVKAEVDRIRALAGEEAGNG
jgi:hypothetical protein